MAVEHLYQEGIIAEPKTISLTGLRILDLPWESTTSEKNIEKTTALIRYQDVVLPLEITKAYIDRSWVFTFTLNKASEKIIGRCYLRTDNNTQNKKIHATTSIYRDKAKDAQPILPIGIGTALYESMLSFIQEYSNAHAVEIIHVVCSMPGLRGNNPLTQERWNEIFLPILKKNGYRQARPDETSEYQDYFVKEYTHQNR